MKILVSMATVWKLFTKALFKFLEFFFPLISHFFHFANWINAFPSLSHHAIKPIYPCGGICFDRNSIFIYRTDSNLTTRRNPFDLFSNFFGDNYLIFSTDCYLLHSITKSDLV